MRIRPGSHQSRNSGSMCKYYSDGGHFTYQCQPFSLLSTSCLSVPEDLVEEDGGVCGQQQNDYFKMHRGESQNNFLTVSSCSASQQFLPKLTLLALIKAQMEL